VLALHPFDPLLMNSIRDSEGDVVYYLAHKDLLFGCGLNGTSDFFNCILNRSVRGEIRNEFSNVTDDLLCYIRR
jgi:hypothetical protein